MGRNSTWRQDFEVEDFYNQQTWTDAANKLIEWLESVRDEFPSICGDVEMCLVVRDWNRTRVATCGTDTATGHGAEDLGKAVKRQAPHGGGRGWPNPVVHPSSK